MIVQYVAISRFIHEFYQYTILILENWKNIYLSDKTLIFLFQISFVKKATDWNNNWYWFIIAFILTFSTINYTFKLSSWKVLHLYNCIIIYIIVNNDMKCISNTSNQNFIVRRSIQGMCLMTISFHLILLVQSHNRNHLGRFWYDVPVQGAFF